MCHEGVDVGGNALAVDAYYRDPVAVLSSELLDSRRIRLAGRSVRRPEPQEEGFVAGRERAEVDRFGG